MGVIVDPLFGVWDFNHFQHTDSLFPRLLLIHIPVQPQGFDDLLAAGHGGVQRGHGVLEDHADVAAPILLQFFAGHFEHVFIRKQDLRAFLDDGLSLGKQAHDGFGGDGLAAAGFAYKAQGFAAVQMKADVADGPNFACIGVEGHLQVIYI